MNLKIRIFLLIAGLLFFFVTLKLIKNKELRPSFAILWFFISLILISLPIFNQVYKFIAFNILGFVDATNLVYIILIGFLLIYSLVLTIFLSRMSNRLLVLISFSAILEHELRRLREQRE